MGRIRILIAEDSALFVEVLRELIEAELDMWLVGVAANGAEAVEMCAALRPDLVLMDIQMPVMDGLTATGHIMARCPTPILVVTADPYHGGVDMSFKALSAGALDLVSKPGEVPMREAERLEFLRKMRILAEVPVVRHIRHRVVGAAGERRQGASEGRFHGARRRVSGQLAGADTPVVGIVASTGGPRALGQLLGGLPADFGAPILLVQHITRGFSVHLSRWLGANSKLEVVVAEDAQPVRSGCVYIAPTDLQMELSAARTLKVYDGPAVAGHRPSGDVLLRSLARHGLPRAVGLVLSGMGQDGAVGMAALYRSGATTLVQDEESSVVYGMPRAALERGVVTQVVALEEMAARLKQIVDKLADSPTA